MKSVTDYLEAAKSPYHAVEFTKKRLAEAGFKELDIKEEFNIKRGGCYYCTPYSSVLFAFKIAENKASKAELTGKMHIACAHTDSPSFKIKPAAECGAKAGVYRINVEPYGGGLKRTWFDRPLGIAGTVVLRGYNPYAPENVLFDSNEPWFIIPSLAPHMDREIEERKLDVQKELIPLYRLEEENAAPGDHSLLSIIAKRLGVKGDDILDFDLSLYLCEKSELCGVNGDFLLAHRIDNIASAAALTEGLIDEKTIDSVITNACSIDDNDISMIALFDNEEIGSRSKQGADSGILSWIIDKIFESSLFCKVSKSAALAGSKMLSVDGAHAVHPNYPEKADETTRAYLGKGVVLKTSASQRYVTDANMAGILMALCEENDIPLQKQANRSGTPGGQTLGPIASSYLPIPAADIGIPMLAMHSIKETMCIRDYEALLNLMKVWNCI